MTFNKSLLIYDWMFNVVTNSLLTSDTGNFPLIYQTTTFLIYLKSSFYLSILKEKETKKQNNISNFSRTD